MMRCRAASAGGGGAAWQQCLQDQAVASLLSTASTQGAVQAMCEDMPGMAGCTGCADGQCANPLGASASPQQPAAPTLRPPGAAPG
jgi:hypothetical protein